jgi:hypothetical protein
MAEAMLPAPGATCSNIWSSDCSGTYILYTEGELVGLIECSRCGHTPNGAAYADTAETEKHVHAHEIGGHTFHTNGDWSGSVRFTAADPEGVRWDVELPFSALARVALIGGGGEPVLHVPAETCDAGDEVTVLLPLSEIRELVGRRVGGERIAQLEQMTGEELFALGRSDVEQWAAE